ncbi:MAG: 16S rRNA (uracil(1498)-N(3))-methyltransferase [Deltaproteobacteria bacterium]|nr:16S rRNA (uracil(1498)-N(3))-methyltransferase [Deltaproteobacteria bacterium]
MNLLLVEPEEAVESGLARVTGRKARHVARVLGKRVGDTIRVGELGGQLGEGKVERIDDDECWVRYAVDSSPPTPSPVSLILALPRPPMLRRILQHVTALGIKRVVLLHAARVEKSFWGSHSVTPDAIEDQLLLGLEQARDTVLPRVELRSRFLPFVQDELDTWAPTGARLVAHPDPQAKTLEPTTQPVTLAVGPEGGWVPFELDQLAALGFVAVSLGPRILRVETAVVASLGRLHVPP